MMESENTSQDDYCIKENNISTEKQKQEMITSSIRRNITKWLRGLWRGVLHFVIPMVLSVVLSVFFSILFIRDCLEFTWWGNIGKTLCGNDFKFTNTTFKRLVPEDFSVVSNVPESLTSIATGHNAASLVDGDQETFAAPDSREIDYAISLFDTYEIKQIKVKWGAYGIIDNYIQEWSFEASEDGQNWVTIMYGGSPKEDSTLINQKFVATDFRIRARSEKDWIGIYEVEVVAKSL